VGAGALQGALGAGQQPWTGQAVAFGPRTAQQVLPAPGGYWADASRGSPQPGMSYAQVLTPRQQPAGAQGTENQQAPLLGGATPFAAGPTAQYGPLLGALQGRAGADQTAYGPRTTPAEQAGMQLPNQLSPTDWNRTDPYAQKMTVAGYENAGEDPASVMWRYQQSLPRATGPRVGSYQAA